jgi:ABC-2 type transport system permease protein
MEKENDMPDEEIEQEVERKIEESTEEYLHRTNARRAFTGAYIVWLRDLKRFWRDTPRRVGMFVQPLIYLFLLGTGLQAAFKVFGGGNTKYILFMFPGILGMTVLFTSVFSAISILWDREFGFLKEILVSPVPRSSVAFGKVIGGASQAMIQGMILLVLMFFPFMYGFSLETLVKAIVLIPLVLLLAIGMTSIGVAIASNMKSMEGFPMVMNFLLLPLFFLSGAMFPLQGLPGWMNFLTKINPLSYGVDMLRGVCLRGVNVTGGSATALLAKMPASVKAGISPEAAKWLIAQFSQMKLQTQRYPIWLDITVVAGFSVLMLGIAIWQFGRQA